ncbi:phosphoribosylanthranilate isomerase [Nocardia lasii]|uniref:N-(5'-phosphoribosyl)anthranilate isomerase n=1 Tax=Nocardia lasii TaxID=1616107 RepID=A0ABW1JVB1_9NOCA
MTTSPFRAKICGIRSVADLETALAAEPDAIGFISGITHFSEDQLARDAAKLLSTAVAATEVARVLVTHLDDAEQILALADTIGVDAIQIHGLVPERTVKEVYAHAGERQVLRAVHVTGRGAIDTAIDAAQYCHVVLLDSRTSSRLGGTGRTHDWEISGEIVTALHALDRKVTLAGGLTPDNVAEAIATVRPFGVDVNSGVDDNVGNKSFDACWGFVRAARAALAANSAHTM